MFGVAVFADCLVYPFIRRWYIYSREVLLSCLLTAIAFQPGCFLTMFLMDELTGRFGSAIRQFG